MLIKLSSLLSVSPPAHLAHVSPLTGKSDYSLVGGCWHPPSLQLKLRTRDTSK